ncbi:PEP-CTERM sorting domain-containing protein [Duganella sp. S19_KUP01_CR8]|uniref:PEP-CTERM sorting domain-containing protein n=1 Tax=Duganella sp. S19_KUP01_CR8 TaxID=3025502 RepID=UPI002FCD9312
MKMKHLALAATLGLTLSLTAPLSQAALTNAGSSVTNLQFQVTDLTPGDAQAGGITVKYRQTAYEVEAGFATFKDYSDFRAVSDSRTDLDRKAWISTGDFGDLRARAESSNIPPPYMPTDARANIWQSMTFWLLPHSAISLSGHAAGFAQRDAGVENGQGLARTAASLSRLGSDHAELGYFSKNVSLDALTSQAGYSGDFLFEYANNSDDAQYLFWNIYTTSQAWIFTPDPIPSVPEPEGYAMLGAGLMFLGLMARRRKPG